MVAKVVKLCEDTQSSYLKATKLLGWIKEPDIGLYKEYNKNQ